MTGTEMRHLRCVVALAEELHFGRAARRLGMSQPPLSQALAQLEARLGARLFDRDQRGVRITPAGQAFAAEARVAIQAAGRAAEAARRAARGEAGELRLGLFASAPLSRGVAEAIAAFRADLPAARLTLTEAPSHRQVAMLAAGELDAGFLRSPVRPLLPTGVQAVEAVRERLCAILPPGHRLARDGAALPVSALAGEPMVFFARAFSASMHDQVHALCAAAGFVPAIAQEANGNAMILGLVSAGLGVSVLPAAQCRTRPAGVVARPLADEAAVTASWLAYRAAPEALLAARFAASVSRRGVVTEDLRAA